ncbi:DUF4011 domain-containing protein [Paenibacillus sp. FSL R10-2734]|uniref:DUF4011 domain-containing protein n=1 Tax=Paenibacillus sp. FSL R10-2734 TaxID=2954691 RepID=UPI0030DD0A43
MSDMVLLASKNASKVATVACPKCGRISRQILKDEYRNSIIANFNSSHICPVCNTKYSSTSCAESGKYSNSYDRYLSQGEQLYNSDVNTAYISTQNRNLQNFNKTSGASGNDAIFALSSILRQMASNRNREAEVSAIEATSSLPEGHKADKFATYNQYPNSIENSNVVNERVSLTDMRPSDLEVASTTVAIITVGESTKGLEVENIEPQQNKPSGPSPMYEALKIPKVAPIGDRNHSNEKVLKRKVEHWKKQLLDLSKRNKMINYRETKRATLKILDPEFTELFNRLAVTEEQLTFQRPIDKDSDLRTFSMLSLLETLSYPIPVHVGDIKTDGSLLERRNALNNLRSKSKLARDEQGTNILYLSFGFIEWKESNSTKAQWMKSPVLMMPVSLKLESIQAPYTLLRYDDDIEVNPTLDYLFNERYGIDLPTFELNGEDSIVQYMQTIEGIADQHGWKVIREVSLGLLSFLKISMYHDLNNNYERMLENPVIRAITGDINAANNVPSELTHFDIDRVSPNDYYQVVNSDSSQQEAILLSKAGVSFVMQGPPGTGKSQTITNIIAEALADGKTILFVSEKAAALQVVYKRLSEVGLDDFCLALHSHKANKKDILDSIAANLKLPRKRIKDSALFELTELFQNKQNLNQYVRELHEEVLPLEKSLYEIFGELISLQNVPYIQFNVASPAEISSASYNTMLYCVNNYAKAMKNFGQKLSDNPWRETVVKMVTQNFRDDLLRNISGLSDSLNMLDKELSNTLSTFELEEACTWYGALRITALFYSIESTPLFPPEWAKMESRKSLLDEAKKAKIEKEEYLTALSDVLKHFNESIFNEDLPTWLDAVQKTISDIFNINGRLSLNNNSILEKIDESQELTNDVLKQLESVITAYELGYKLLPLNVKTLEDLKLYSTVISDVLESPIIIREWFDESTLHSARKMLLAARGHADTIGILRDTFRIQWDCKTISHSVCEYQKSASDIITQLRPIADALERSITIFPILSNSTINDASILFHHISDLFNAPGVKHNWFDDKIFANAKQMLKEASIHASLLIDKENHLLQAWDIKALSIDADDMLLRFKTEYTSILKIFKTSYHSDIKKIRSVSKKVGVKFTVNDIVDLLQNIIDINEEKRWFVENQQVLFDCFGDFYLVEKSDWAAIEAGLSYIESIFALFPHATVPKKVIDIICEKSSHTNSYAELAKTLPLLSDGNLKIVEGLIGEIIPDCTNCNIIDFMLPRFERIFEVCGMLIPLVQRDELSLLELNTLDALIKYIDEAAQLGIAFENVDIRTLLNNLIMLSDEKRWFIINQNTLDENFGQFNVGELSDWTAIETGISFTERIRSLFVLFYKSTVPQRVVDLLCDKSAHASEYAELTKVLPAINTDELMSINENIGKVLSDYSDYGIQEFLIPFLNRLNELNNSLIDLIHKMNVHVISQVPNHELIEKVIAACKVTEKRNILDISCRHYEEKFDNRIAGLKTNWDAIISDLESVSALFESSESSLMVENFVSLFCNDADYRNRIITTKNKLHSCIEENKTRFTEFKKLFATKVDLDNVKISEVVDKVSSCLNNIKLLDNWISCVETKAACDELGLSDFTERIEQHDNTLEDIPSIFKRGFFTLWTQSVFGSKKTVEYFRRQNHDEKINRFVSLDERQLLIAQERIKQSVISGIPDANRVLAANDELSILLREIGKKRRIMSLRNLFKSIPNLLLKLKPCMMMSPLSVAYFLEAESYEFDMVIFDEASQIFPQDAIGSIFRGKQVIIAGDSKQLPPSNFFATSTSNDKEYDEEDDEIVGTEIYDSILEETTDVLPNRTLLWHYRSKHENLIAFSNQEIYQNELVTFPSNVSHGIDTGVEFVYVKNGVYEGKGRNTSEARRCVELVKRHIERTPNRSLGIIAFSESQQKTIALEIQKFREQHPEYEGFFVENKEGEFFIKNLENVQGDERDTIIFSVSYAKTREQIDNNRSMALRFGPLGQKGGERRLNVAITRAKSNIKLVSSILPYDLSHAESEGVKMLRQYIDFAMNGAVALGIDHIEGRKDVFLDVVAEYLVNHGYKIKKYVGCSGYRIDLAVIHPHNDDCFVAGIECDGFSYAAAKSARDRDHLRKSVLEAMGWRIYRAWSPEWMVRQDIEGEKLLNFIDTAIMEFKEEISSEVSDPSGKNVLVESFTEEMEAENELQVQASVPSLKADLSNPYDFTEYTEAVWHETPEIMEFFGDDRVAEEIKYIVGIEQPIYIDLLYQRMAGAFGNQKATSPVRNMVDRVIRGNQLKSLIVIDKEGFVTFAGFHDLKVRIASDGNSPRKIDFISPDEIGLAMLTIAEHAIGLTSDSLIDATIRALGYARRGVRMLTCMNNALDRLIKVGRIKLVDEKVRVIGGGRCE